MGAQGRVDLWDLDKIASQTRWRDRRSSSKKRTQEPIPLLGQQQRAGDRDVGGEEKTQRWVPIGDSSRSLFEKRRDIRGDISSC
jgi:hypothetical protein